MAVKVLMNKNQQLGVSNGGKRNEFVKKKDNELKSFYAITSGKLMPEEQVSHAREVHPDDIPTILNKAKTGLVLTDEAKKVLGERYNTYAMGTEQVFC